MNLRISIFGGAPFLRFCLAFIAGIAISDRIAALSNIYLIGIYLSFIAFLVVLNKTEKNSKYSITAGIFYAILFVTFGAGYKTIYETERFKTEIPLHAYYSGIVNEKSPATKNRFKYEVKLDIIKAKDSIIVSDETILLFVTDSITNLKLIPGHQITFESKLNPIASLNNPGEFDYQQYLKNKGIRYQAYVKSDIVIGLGIKNNLKTKALNIRSFLLNAYEKNGIKGDEFAVLAALTLGEKDFLTKQVMNSFVATGALHVLSVSGLHVGIIYLFLSYLLMPLGKNKKLNIVRFAILFSFLWFYAFITGLSPSVLRSCAMFTFVLIGESINRKSNIYNSLATSAFMLVLLNPFFLFDVGFQLSYMALISIVYFQPKLASIYQPKNKYVNKLWDLLLVSVAAQIGTFPVSIYYFHQFPTYFMISNYAVIPLSGIILYGAFLFYFTSWIPIISKLVAFLLNVVLIILNYSVRFIENLPGSLITDIWISKLTLLFLIVTIILIAFYIKFRNSKSLILSILLVLLMTINFSNESIKSNKQDLIIFYNSYNDPLISIISGKNHYYYSPSDSISGFSRTLLDNTSGCFRTTEAISISDTLEKQTEIKKYENHLYIRDLVLKIETNIKTDKTLNDESDIYWNTKDAKVSIKNNPDMACKTIKMGKLVKFSVTNLTDGFKMKEQGALLLFY